jgi:hypothetical protein
MIAVPPLIPALQFEIGEANKCQVSHFYYSPISRTAKLMSATRKNHGHRTSSDDTGVPSKNLLQGRFVPGMALVMLMTVTLAFIPSIAHLVGGGRCATYITLTVQRYISMST